MLRTNLFDLASDDVAITIKITHGCMKVLTFSFSIGISSASLSLSVCGLAAVEDSRTEENAVRSSGERDYRGISAKH